MGNPGQIPLLTCSQVCQARHARISALLFQVRIRTSVHVLFQFWHPAQAYAHIHKHFQAPEYDYIPRKPGLFRSISRKIILRNISSSLAKQLTPQAACLVVESQLSKGRVYLTLKS